MREIVLDTETTGLDPAAGHRIVEIGCVELINHLPTGKNFHRYLNPEREVPDEVVRIHGLTNGFLADKPLFAEIADEFLDFLAEDPLVIHNAEFDLKFLNAELARLNKPALPSARATDTVVMARRRFPGAQANLDALCRRFGIDNTHRDKHGALLDSELLAEVYLALIGGREPGLQLGQGKTADLAVTAGSAPVAVTRPFRAPRPHAASPEEEAAHAAFIAKLKSPIWLS